MDAALPRLLLTDQERDRFAAFCEMEAKSNEAMAEQIANIKAPEVLAKKYRSEALAFKIVAGILRSTITETI